MSRRAESRRRARRQVFIPPELEHADWSVVAGWAADDEHLDEARQGTHDILIDLMGHRRSGPVRWTQHRPADAFGVLATLRAGATPVMLDHYRQLEQLVRDEGGWLVLALAPGHIEDGP